MKMHRFPKLFSHSSERRKPRADSSSSRRPAKPKRLERSYALRNVNYELSPSTSGSSSSHSPEESQRARSLDLYGGKTSFRVDGTEGEFEVICEAFGFSGIDDFAISLEDYEAMKVRSSPCIISEKLEPVICQENQVDCGGDVKCSGGNGYVRASDLINREIEGFRVGYLDDSCGTASKKLGETCDFGYANRCRAYLLGDCAAELSKKLDGGVHLSDKLSVRSKAARDNGIRGVRPTIVVPPWDTPTGFALERNSCAPRFQSGFFADKAGNEEVGRNRSEQEKYAKIKVIPREENCVLWESCSFTSNDDDSSSSATEPMSNMSSNERYGRVIRDWQKGELLGRGTFGSVYEGIADGGFFFAVKEVSLLDQEEGGRQCIIQLEQEIALLSQFEHENIVRYYGTEKDGSHLYIFLELVSQGSLLRLYKKYDLRVPQVSGYTRQILHGLKYLHDRNVIHRDIKCANILVHTNGLVKLADFGLAKMLPRGGGHSRARHRAEDVGSSSQSNNMDGSSSHSHSADTISSNDIRIPINLSCPIRCSQPICENFQEQVQRLSQPQSGSTVPPKVNKSDVFIDVSKGKNKKRYFGLGNISKAFGRGESSQLSSQSSEDIQKMKEEIKQLKEGQEAQKEDIKQLLMEGREEMRAQMEEFCSRFLSTYRPPPSPPPSSA